MAKLVTQESRYEYSLDDIKKLIAADMKLPFDAITVIYELKTDDDYLSHFPSKSVYNIRVIVDELKAKKL